MFRLFFVLKRLVDQGRIIRGVDGFSRKLDGCRGLRIVFRDHAPAVQHAETQEQDLRPASSKEFFQVFTIQEQT